MKSYTISTITRPSESDKREALLKEMFAEIGSDCYIEPPLYSNWGGRHVHFGNNVYANFNLTLVDDTHIYVGDYTMFGPNVTVATAGHPILPELREKVYQYNMPVKIGRNCWIGAGAIIVPGVTIGDNTVIGAGSVVTKDIPSNVVAVGNPCCVLREIGEKEKMDNYMKLSQKLEKNIVIRKIATDELPILTELHDYEDIDDMLASNKRRIENGGIDIFCLFDGERLIGELRTMYKHEDSLFAIDGKRAYLYAYRIHTDFQGQGLGKYLMNYVIDTLEKLGYTEFTIGVEDDNTIAQHIYQSLGFTELLARTKEEYQGDSYEYNLYLKR